MTRFKSLLWLIIPMLVVGITGYFTYLHYRAVNSPYPPDIQNVLELAGNNRRQLEKVLEHYSDNPADSLKLKAAVFLIVNMPGKYSEYYDAPWNDVAAVSRRWSSSADKHKVLTTFGLGKKTVQEDIYFITADYLINNIDMAFKAWKDAPWGSTIDFATFCEEILPYRVNTEPLENWRAKVLASYSTIYQSFMNDPSITNVEACEFVNRRIPAFKLDYDYPAMNFSQTMATGRGYCRDLSAMVCYVMRAMGIPVMVDYTPCWGFKDVNHIWSVVRDSSGHHIPFMCVEASPYTDPEKAYMATWKISKIYRKTFAIHQNVPKGYPDHCVEDVSAKYSNTVSLTLPIRFVAPQNVTTAWLATPGCGSNWHLAGWGSIKNKKVNFHSIGMRFLYLPTYDLAMKQSVNYPFVVNADSSIHLLKPDTSKMQSVALYFSVNITGIMLNGRFEGANREDFFDAQLLSVIEHLPKPTENIIKLAKPAKYRYVRYCTPDGNYCYMAEIRFCNAKGVRLNGTPIGVTLEYNASPNTFEKVFDNNPHSYFESGLGVRHVWTGLDLGEPRTIAKIHYLPLNEDVTSGNRCSLFYWDRYGWRLLDTQTLADDLQMHCRVPSNALFYIKNNDTGKDSQMFYVENETQYFDMFYHY